jgi:hypothetical protein
MAAYVSQVLGFYTNWVRVVCETSASERLILQITKMDDY